jgi:hypothetical protein
MFSIRGGKIVQLLQLKQLDRRYDNSLVRPRYQLKFKSKDFDFSRSILNLKKKKKNHNIFFKKAILITAQHLNNESNNFKKQLPSHQSHITHS